MLLTFDVLRDLVGTIAVMALLAVAYGTAMRALARPFVAQAVLGALFGGAAALSALAPIQVADGVAVDLRLVPVLLAGAFLGVPGAVAAALVALGARLGPDGGMAVEAAGLAASGLAGLAWDRLVGRLPHPARRWASLLTALALLGPPILLLLPWDAALAALAALWPVLTPFDCAAALAAGVLLERERLILDKERRLGHAAARDRLTGLLNRRGFETEVAPLLRRKRGGAILVLDLDHFKRVNDTLGHATGDAVLRSLAARLSEACRPKDVVARFGGEEVVVFLPHLSLAEAQDAAARLCEVVRAKPFVLPSGRRRAVTASVGGAWTGGRVNLDALVARADAALYAAKEAGRNRWRFDVDGGLTGASADLAHATLYRARRAAEA
jgi:diguanylate cyclase (GGDEF)-like protein